MDFSMRAVCNSSNRRNISVASSYYYYYINSPLPLTLGFVALSDFIIFIHLTYYIY